MRDVYVLGGVNMDYVISLPRLPSTGETVKGSNLLVNPGGKGGNQAVGCAKLGTPAYMISNIGSDSIGQQLLSAMKDYGVRMDYVSEVEGKHTGTALIFVDPTGENMIGFSPGATEEIDRDTVDRALQGAEPGDVFLSGLEAPVEIVAYAVESATNKDMKVLVNPAPAQSLPEDIYQYIDIFTPNETEAAAMVGSDIEGVEGALSSGASFLEKGVDSLIITLGSKGCVLIEEEGKRHFPAVELGEEVVDTTAAGDAFNSALAVSLAKDLDLEEGVQLANLAAGLTTTKEGAQSALPTLEEVNSKREKNE